MEKPDWETRFKRELIKSVQMSGRASGEWEVMVLTFEGKGIGYFPYSFDTEDEARQTKNAIQAWVCGK